MTPTPEETKYYCEDCGETRPEGPAVSYYCQKHLKDHLDPPEKNSWQERFDTKGFIDQVVSHGVFQEKYSLKRFISEVESQARREEQEKARAMIHDWVASMWAQGIFHEADWTGEDEVEASIQSYLEGNHLKNTPQ